MSVGGGERTWGSLEKEEMRMEGRHIERKGRLKRTHGGKDFLKISRMKNEKRE